MRIPHWIQLSELRDEVKLGFLAWILKEFSTGLARYSRPNDLNCFSRSFIVRKRGQLYIASARFLVSCNSLNQRLVLRQSRKYHRHALL